MLYYIHPMVCVVSLFMICSLLTPSVELVNTINYLDHKLHSCPLDEHMMVHDQTMLSDNFYEYTLLSRLTEAIPMYFDRIEPIVNILIGIFVVSSLMTIKTVLSTLISMF